MVEPDRAALPTLGTDGTYVAMSVRVRKDSRPRHASGFLPTPEGLPVQAALGQRVRVWRVSDGTWLDPFAAWTTSWGARWSPDGQLLAAFVHRGHQAPSVAVWNSSTTPPRRLTDGDGRWPPRGSSDVRGDYQAPRWLDQDTVIWHREGFGFVTVSLDIPDVIVTLTPEGQHEQWLHDVDDHTLPLSANGSFRSIRESAGEFHLDQIKPRTAERITVARHSGSVSTSQLHVGGWPNGGAFMVRSTSQPGEVWLAEHDKARHLAALNPGLSPVHTARRISWTRRGERLAAGILVPHGPAPETGWPLVVNVYGGSRASTLVDEYDPDNGILHASLLTSRGWAVMFPDLPISDHDPMRQFAPLLRSALDNLPHNLVDPSRIAIIGNSYGSYTALSLLVTMPGTFSAAAVSAPLANPIASYAALRSDGAAFDGFWERAQGRMSDPPWVNPQTWVDNSPFLYLDHIDSPLLIAVGTHGIPGEQAQAEQLFAGLRRLNRTTELRHYNGEGHSPSTWSPAAYTDFAQRLLTWIGASTPI